MENIILEDNQLGEYGVEAKIGNEVYIDFHVPARTYDVYGLTAGCTIFVIDNASTEPVQTVQLSEKNSQAQIAVTDTLHIELTAYGKVSLVSVE